MKNPYTRKHPQINIRSCFDYSNCTLLHSLTLGYTRCDSINNSDHSIAILYMPFPPNQMIFYHKVTIQMANL